MTAGRLHRGGADRHRGPGHRGTLPGGLFAFEAASRTKRVCISSARVDTDSPRDMTGKPSLVLRCLGKQESAWDLAKACNTTIRDLLAANQLESEEAIPREKLLLIPRKRA